MPLSERSIRLLATCTARYLTEVVEPNEAIIAFVGASPRAVKREIEDALDAANETLNALAAAQKRHAEPAPAAEPKPEPATNREKIAAAIAEHEAAGVANA